MSAPLVSVVIPVHDGAAFLAETLESVLHQTWPRTEVVVVDDGSTDDSAARVHPYRDRIAYLRQENRGGGAARNAGVAASRGDYVAFLDQDDLWEPNKLERQVDVARAHSSSGLVACDGTPFGGGAGFGARLLHGHLARCLDRSADGTWTGDAHAALLHGNAVSTPGQTLLPRAVWEEVGPMVEGRDEPYDYDYWLRIALEHPVTLHRDAHVRWRCHAASRSGPEEDRRLRWALMDLGVLERQLGAVPPNRRGSVRAALRRRAGHAHLAWARGRREGMDGAREALARLSRAAPTSPWPRLWYLATFLPTPAIRAPRDAGPAPSEAPGAEGAR